MENGINPLFKDNADSQEAFERRWSRRKVRSGPRDNQWTEEEVRLLVEAKHPPLRFNMIKPDG